MLAGAPGLAATLRLKTPLLSVLTALCVPLGLAPVDSDAAAEMLADGDVERVPLDDGEMVAVSVAVGLGVTDVLGEELAPSASTPVGAHLMDWVRLAVMLGVPETLGVILVLAPTLSEDVAVLDTDGLRVGDEEGEIDDVSVPEPEEVPEPEMVSAAVS